MKRKYRNRKARYSRTKSKLDTHKELDDALSVHTMLIQGIHMSPPYSTMQGTSKDLQDYQKERPGKGSTKFELVLPKDELPDWIKESEYYTIDWTQHKNYTYGNAHWVDNKPKPHKGLFRRLSKLWFNFLLKIYVRIRKSNSN